MPRSGQKSPPGLPPAARPPPPSRRARCVAHRTAPTPHAADNFLTAYFNVSWPSGVVALSLKAQLYLALVAQALLVKSDISTRRARNSFGVAVWQLNEIW